jgi:PAS domain S-box-containing protein
VTQRIQSETTFRLAVENAPIGTALVQPNGCFLQVNQALCQMLGYAREELLSNDFHSITHPEDLERELLFVQRMLKREISTYQTELRYLRKDGRTVWTLLSASLVSDSDDQPQYIISQIQDIDARKEAERLKAEFIAVVSHELRTPLTSIAASLEILGDGGDRSDLSEELIRIAQTNSQRLVRLVNDILDIEKLEAGKVPFNMQRAGIASLIEQAIEDNRPLANSFGVTLRFENASQYHVHADADRLTQVAANLLSNACKFSEPGGEVVVRAEDRESTVRVSVRDHGPGIPEDFKPHIFARFAQADGTNTREVSGTGLGLSIAKEIVQRHGGEISFADAPEGGTIFFFDLPALANGEDASFPPKEAPADDPRKPEAA